MALLGAKSRPSTDLRSAPNAVGGFAGHCVRDGERCDARPVGSGDDATAAPVSALPVGIFTGASKGGAGTCVAGGFPLREKDEHPDRMEELVRAVEAVGCDRLVRTVVGPKDRGQEEVAHEPSAARARRSRRDERD
jgi:hypothetical protein